jgi:hypothetical protein
MRARATVTAVTLILLAAPAAAQPAPTPRPQGLVARIGGAVQDAAVAVVDATAAAADAIEPPDLGGFWALTFENDIFAGTDRDYTNGVRVSYTSHRNDLPLWGRAARDHLGWLTDARDWYVAYAIGQNMFTPTDISDPTPPATERPYAGFLYASAAIIADRGDRLDTIALDMGVVGPSALAEQSQKLVHDIGGFEDPQGWDAQLEDEFGFRLLYERKDRYGADIGGRLLDLEVDAAPHYSLALGNVDTSAAAGLTVRIGADLESDYGPPRIRPAVSGPAFFGEGDGFAWNLFLSAEARAVGRNIFLEGNTFRDSPSVDPHRLIGEVSAGVSTRFDNVELTYTHVLRSKEYEGQEDPAMFGSVNVRMRF